MMRKLPQKFVEKIWGVERLPNVFPEAPRGRIGEIWFEPPAELDSLLVKYIFTSERLSVQVHPDDGQARNMGFGDSGKSECWVIVDAEPGAEIAVGFRRDVEPEELRRTALDGSILDILTWHKVRKGDVFYIPAGTVHAIGAGVSLIEVQQNSDITFRLYDYGRPRDLHLDQGMQVASGTPYPTDLKSRIGHTCGSLVNSSHFELFSWSDDASSSSHQLRTGPALLVPFDGPVNLAGKTVNPGECAIVDGSLCESLEGEGTALLAQPVTPFSAGVA